MSVSNNSLQAAYDPLEALKNSIFYRLPNEVVTHIFSFLPDHLFKVELICKFWKALVKEAFPPRRSDYIQAHQKLIERFRNMLSDRDIAIEMSLVSPNPLETISLYNTPQIQDAAYKIIAMKLVSQKDFPAAKIVINKIHSEKARKNGLENLIKFEAETDQVTVESLESLIGPFKGSKQDRALLERLQLEVNSNNLEKAEETLAELPLRVKVLGQLIFFKALVQNGSEEEIASYGELMLNTIQKNKKAQDRRNIKSIKQAAIALIQEHPKIGFEFFEKVHNVLKFGALNFRVKDTEEEEKKFETSMLNALNFSKKRKITIPVDSESDQIEPQQKKRKTVSE